MRIIECQQGTPQWYAARLALPTASNFGKILTATGKKSTQAKAYMDVLLAEFLTGEHENGYANAAMARGTALEPEARAYYEFTTDRDVQEVGFVLRDDGLVGCSPDGLVGNDGGLEIKCALSSTHIGYLREKKVPTEYLPQVQGGMYVCECQWWDVLLYHPSLPSLVIRVERDEEYIKTLAAVMDAFVHEMRIQQQLLRVA